MSDVTEAAERVRRQWLNGEPVKAQIEVTDEWSEQLVRDIFILGCAHLVELDSSPITPEALLAAGLVDRCKNGVYTPADFSCGVWQTESDAWQFEAGFDGMSVSTIGEFRTLLRLVLACVKCNNLRAKTEEASLPLDELRRRSGSYPRG